MKYRLKMNDFENVIGELMSETGLNREVSEEILNEGIDSIFQNLEKIEAHVRGGNIKEAAKVLHQLKGSSGNLRIKDVAEKAIKAEQAAGEGDVKRLSDLVAEMRIINSRLLMWSKGTG